MPIGRQPRGARGTVERPYSALRLRLVLAVFGLVVCTGGGVLLLAADHVGVAIALFVLAAIAVADIAVIGTRLRR